MEWALSLRGLGILFFVLAGALTAGAGWLRPPLSSDIRGFELPLAGGASAAASPEEVLYGPRRLLLASPGILLLALTALGVLVVLWRPRLLGLASGLLLWGGLAATAVTLCNYPTLIEMLDQQQDQRQHVVGVLRSPPEVPPLTDFKGRVHAVRTNGRVSAAPAQDQEWGGLVRGWVYLKYIPYVACLGAVGVLLGTAGSLGRRLAWCAVWIATGLALAGAVCWRRLAAEYHWLQAKVLEAQCNLGGATLELEKAVAQVPEFAHMQRTWLLVGKIDYRNRRLTPQALLFRAHQHVLKREWPHAFALLSQMRSETRDDGHVVQDETASAAVNAGLSYYAKQDLAAAEDMWRFASRVAPKRLDSRLLLAVVLGRVDPQGAELVEACLGPLVGPGLADQPLRADSLVILGDALFNAGKINAARRCYAESLDVYCLPRATNYRAEKGLGGP
jgi:hypothetical protein